MKEGREYKNFIIPEKSEQQKKEQLISKEDAVERHELKGIKKEIEYSGIPLDVYLADKHLQIIDVRDDPRWDADYLLIDPVTFDQIDPATGFKGIRENESFVVGRQNPLRFELPNTVSGTHLKIELKNGRLILEDLNSTNGTILQLEKPRQISKEIEAGEAALEREQAIVKFRDYIEKYGASIENELQQGRDLDDIFYHDFYNKIDNPKYRESDPAVQRLKNVYEENVKKAQEHLLKETQAGRNITPLSTGGYWLYCHVNKGIRRDAELGRFYFNLKPEDVGSIFVKAAEAFRDAGLNVLMKIPPIGDAETFNRLDKMVIYFDSEEEQQALKIIESLYQSNRLAFDETGIPRFTAEVKSFDGSNLSGVGFAEEPLFRNESFGSICAKILAQVYFDAKYSRLTISDPKFDFESSFRRACQKYQVDPLNPAFNLARKATKFQELRRRMAIQ